MRDARRVGLLQDRRRSWSGSVYLRTLAVSSPKILSDEQIAAVARKIRDTGYGQHAPVEEG